MIFCHLPFEAFTVSNRLRATTTNVQVKTMVMMILLNARETGTGKRKT
jgi:hypothetical protein